MIDLRQYEALKAKAEAEQSRADRAAGALEQTRKQIQRDFDCADLKAAEKELKRLEQQVDKFDAAYHEEFNRIKDKYPQLFEER